MASDEQLFVNFFSSRKGEIIMKKLVALIATFLLFSTSFAFALPIPEVGPFYGKFFNWENFSDPGEEFVNWNSAAAKTTGVF